MNDNKDFKITDRRIFDESGEIKNRDAFKAEKEKEKLSETKKEIPPDQKAKTKEPAREKNIKRGHPVQIDFITFITSLHTSGLMHFGLIPDPETGEGHAEPELAKQNIDILEMLETKTKDNLDDEETALLTNALYDLRMRYVELIKKTKTLDTNK